MSKIGFYATGYLFSETSLKTSIRRTKYLIVSLGTHRKLIWACFVTALAWIFPWGQATTWQIRNWKKGVGSWFHVDLVLVFTTVILWKDDYWQHAVHFCTVTGLEVLGIFPLCCLEDTQLGHTAQPALKPAGKLLRSFLEQCLLIIFLGWGRKPVFLFQKPSVSAWGDAHE